VRDIAAAEGYSLAVTHSGGIFHWGDKYILGCNRGSIKRPTLLEGLEGVRVRRVRTKWAVAFAIGDAELFSWGTGANGNVQDQFTPKRVETLQVVNVSSVAVGCMHMLALTEDGVVYAWGRNTHRAVLGNPHVDLQLLPEPVPALQGVRVGSISAASLSSYAVAETGELWAWGIHSKGSYGTPLGHGKQAICRVPKPVELLRRRGVKVDAVVAGKTHVLVVADNGRVYAWGGFQAAQAGALGLGMPSQEHVPMRTPQLVPVVQVALGLL
jgi:alpha-tubulin suppressor-like RCC1 family protein